MALEHPYHAAIHPPAPRSARGFWRRLGIVLEMIKFRHSIFALPFALASMLVAADGLPQAETIFWIVVAAVAARSMAMSFNRFADRQHDARNPRTRDRAIPAGLVTARFTFGFTILSGLVFLFAAAMLNELCFMLSPVTIVVLLGYSYCKRLTRGVHLVLGAALGIAPLGAWIAVTGSMDGLPVFLALGVLFWTAGFDIIYSCLDVRVDRREGLHSLPARAGVAPALFMARGLHALTAICFGLFLLETGAGIYGWISLGVICILFYGQHRLVRPNDLSRVGPAFFTFNAWVSVVFLAGTALDMFFSS